MMQEHVYAMDRARVEELKAMMRLTPRVAKAASCGGNMLKGAR